MRIGLLGRGQESIRKNKKLGFILLILYVCGYVHFSFWGNSSAIRFP